MRELTAQELDQVSGGDSRSYSIGLPNQKLSAPDPFGGSDLLFGAGAGFGFDSNDQESPEPTQEESEQAYTDATGQLWSDRESCLDQARDDQVSHLAESAASGAATGAKAGWDLSPPQAKVGGAVLGGVMGTFGGLSGGAATAPNPQKACPE